MATYGLLGKNIEYSFSKDFFTQKFKTEKRKDIYINFDISEIEKFPEIITQYKDLKGFNVTKPYKQSILPFLDIIEEEAKLIGAVNTVKINKNGALVGYNTDCYGFARSLASFLPLTENSALILGQGGASMAIKYLLDAMQFNTTFVTRTENDNSILYENITQEIIVDHPLIINCTPVGTYPNVDKYPRIPYQFLTKNHLLFDLTYNPQVTEFMKLGIAKGAKVTNGLDMLIFQAEKSWSIWNK